MKQPTILLYVLVAVVAAKDKQIKLEDIERDNLSSERQNNDGTQQHPGQNQFQYQQRPQVAASPAPKMQYGFVPIKSEPQQQYIQQQTYVPQYTQQYEYVQQPDNQYATQFVQQQPQTAYTQTEPQQFSQPQQQEQPQQQQQQQNEPQLQQYTQPEQVTRAEKYTQVQYIPQQQYEQPQLQYEPQIPYIPQQHQHQQPIQYVLDNHLQQTQHQPQTPQYVYLQQYQSASNNIQSVADTKGNIQYVMYVPANYLKPDPSYENILQTYNTQLAQPENEPQIEYEQEKPKYTKAPAQVAPPTIKHQPTSLLDSYVPSYLQYEYYKQQQGNANAIRQPTKLSPAHIGKSDGVKSFRYEEPSQSQVSYKLQHPSAYRNIKH